MYSTNDTGKRSFFTCEVCEKSFSIPTRFLSRKDDHIKHKYCSKICSSFARRKRVIVTRLVCNKAIERTESKLRKSKHGLHFCSRACKDKAQRIDGIRAMHPPHYGDGKCDYRRRAIEYYGCKCAVCDITEIGMLDVHHIDEDRANNAIDNLIVLCANHHVLVTRGLANIVDRQLHMCSTK